MSRILERIEEVLYFRNIINLTTCTCIPTVYAYHVWTQGRKAERLLLSSSRDECVRVPYKRSEILPRGQFTNLFQRWTRRCRRILEISEKKIDAKRNNYQRSVQTLEFFTLFNQDDQDLNEWLMANHFLVRSMPCTKSSEGCIGNHEGVSA
jgi:hypothetical protein